MVKPEKDDEKNKLPCPRCGREMEVNPVFSPLFCGVRAQATCPEGCQLPNAEQERLNLKAGDLLFN